MNGGIPVAQAQLIESCDPGSAAGARLRDECQKEQEQRAPFTTDACKDTTTYSQNARDGPCA